jgi:hypothetical protein
MAFLGAVAFAACAVLAGAVALVAFDGAEAVASWAFFHREGWFVGWIEFCRRRVDGSWLVAGADQQTWKCEGLRKERLRTKGKVEDYVDTNDIEVMVQLSGQTFETTNASFNLYQGLYIISRKTLRTGPVRARYHSQSYLRTR